MKRSTPPAKQATNQATKQASSCSSSSLSGRTKNRLVKALEKTDLTPIAPIVQTRHLVGPLQEGIQKIERAGFIHDYKWTLLGIISIVLVCALVYYYYIRKEEKTKENEAVNPAQPVPQTVQQTVSQTVSQPVSQTVPQTVSQQEPRPVSHLVLPSTTTKTGVKKNPKTYMQAAVGAPVQTIPNPQTDTTTTNSAKTTKNVNEEEEDVIIE